MTVRWMCRMRNRKLHCLSNQLNLPNCHHNSCESDYLGCEQTRMTEQTIRSSCCLHDYLLREILWEENLFFLLCGLCSYSLVPYVGFFYYYYYYFDNLFHRLHPLTLFPASHFLLSPVGLPTLAIGQCWFKKFYLNCSEQSQALLAS